MVRNKIQAFENTASKNSQGKSASAIKVILGILLDGLDAKNPEQYFEEYANILEEKLTDLQTTSASMFNTALNVIGLTFACLSVVGIASLWLSGILQNNYEVTGDSFLFFTFGDKQQAQTIVRNTLDDIINQNKAK